MRFPSLGQVSGTDLLRRLASAVAQDRENTAELLFLLAEADRRRLHAREGFPSMFRYCVRHLRMSEDRAYKRILAARVVRKFPAALAGIAAGRLHLTALVMLAPHLTRANAAELLTAAAHRSKPELQELLAQHFPQADIPVLVQPVVATDSMVQLVPEPVAPAILANASNLAEPMSKTSHAASPAHARPCVPPVAASHARVAPLAPERYAVQFTCDRETHDKLRYAEALLGHALPTGSLPDVFTRALDALIDRLERQKFAKGLPYASDQRGGGFALALDYGARAARGLGARRRALHVREPLGAGVRMHDPARVRPHPALRAGRGFDLRQPAAAVPHAQPAGSEGGVRSGGRPGPVR